MMGANKEKVTCGHSNCNIKLDKITKYACGGKHGKNELSCDKYFCDKHRFFYILPEERSRCTWLCEECLKAAKEQL